jgi:hypothetical protein
METSQVMCGGMVPTPQFADAMAKSAAFAPSIENPDRATPSVPPAVRWTTWGGVADPTPADPRSIEVGATDRSG